MLRCPFCGGEPAGKIETREMMFGLRHPFTYCRCGECASVWLPEPPSDLAGYYGTGYYSMSAGAKGANRIALASLWARVLLRLPAPVASRVAGRRGFPRYLRWIIGIDVSLDSRIADIGSGEAGAIAQMSRHGFADLWGFDPFIAADKDIGSAHYRRRPVRMDDGPFDLVMFNHSLEHVGDPLAALSDAAATLSPGGAIVVRIPVAGSFADRHYGPNWVALDPPRHLAIPSRLGMQQAASRVGLSIARVFFDSQPLQFWASERYRDDVALHEREGPSVTDLRERAAALNRSGDGDMAGYVLRRSRCP
jgi:SAM-dependent methyltransferase